MPQIVIQVLITQNRSLRDIISQDEKLPNYNLKVAQHKKKARRHGWAKLHSTTGEYGAINIQWEPNSRMLICRVITKAGGKPASIISDFIRYLLDRHRRKIEAINIIPR